MSNLLDKASIVTTPTAYDNGKILSVKPAPSLGSELITNGDFTNGSTGWTLGSGWSIGAGVANASGSVNANISQNIFLTIGSKYEVTYTVLNASTGARVGLAPNGSTVQNIRTENGTYTEIYEAVNASFYIRNLWNNGVGLSITNVSVKQAIDGDFDFTRNSSATRVNSQGLIEDITSNLPRIDYTGGEGHWLFEPQSTNLITYSEDFSNSFYVKDSGVSVGTTNNLSPSINANATKIDVTNNGRIYANIATNTYYTTVFIKSGTFSHFKFAGSNIDLIAETNSNGTIQSVGNGWYRVGKSYTGNRPFQIQAYPDGTYSTHTTSGNYFIWGAQSEVQSFATSYIPTSGSTVTRLQDAAFGSGSSDLINSTEGVLYFEGERLSLLGSKRTICISDGSLNNYLYIQLQGVSNTIRIFYKTIETGQVLLLNHNLSNELEFRKYAFRWSNNNFSLWINGIKEIEQLNGNTATSSVLNEINFSLGGGADKFFGKTKCLAVFKEALTDAELECLTTI